MIKLPRLHRRLPVVLKAKLRTKQNDWWTGLTERTQRYADMGDMLAFYEALKAVYGPSHQIQASLRSSDGSTLLTDKEAILQRWSEHFEGLFSDRRTVQESSPAKIPQVDVKLELEGRWGTTYDFATSFLHFFPCSPLPSRTRRTPGLSIP